MAIGRGADELSHFDGYESEAADDLVGFAGYDGYGDDILDFDGQQTSFRDEIQTGRRFTIKVDNSAAGAVEQTIIIFPSYAPSSANVIKDGAFLSIGGASLNATGQPGSINALLNFVFNNPTRCLGFKVQSSHSDQMSKSLLIKPKSPFRSLTDEPIFLEDYRNEHVFQDKMVTVNRRFQVDNQTELQAVIAAGAVTTFTFFFGATLNTAKGLQKKADRAAVGMRAANVRL